MIWQEESNPTFERALGLTMACVRGASDGSHLAISAVLEGAKEDEAMADASGATPTAAAWGETGSEGKYWHDKAVVGLPGVINTDCHVGPGKLRMMGPPAGDPAL